MDEVYPLNFRGRRVVPPLPPGILAAINEFGSEEAVDGHDADGSSSSTAFIVYQDKSGAQSKRRITFKRLAGHYGELEYIDAFCHERRRFRRFSVSGISEMVCPFSGEVFDPLERCLELQQSGALRIDDLVLTDLARLMVFMARCDEDLHPLEEAAIEDVFGRYVRNFGGDDTTYEKAVAESKRIAPDDRDAGKALWSLQRCPEGGQLARFVLDSCGTIVDADGRHSDAEVKWALEVSDALKKIAER